jgi:RecA/RadA recombinase
MAKQKEPTGEVASGLQFAHDFLDIPPFSLLTGGEGIPYRRMTVIVGKKEVGKTTFAYQLGAHVQQEGGKVIWVDTEKSFSDIRAKQLGLDLDKVIYHGGGTIDQVFLVVRAVMDKMREKGVDYPVLVVWDSLTATATQDEVAGEIGKAMGRHARGFSAGARVVKPFMGLTADMPKIMFLVINQWRENINSYVGGYATFGGNPVEQNADLILVFRPGEFFKNSAGVPYARIIKVRADKCRFWYPKREVPAYFDFANGFDKEMSVWLLAKDLGVVERKGSVFALPDGTTTRQSDVINALKADPKFFEHLWDMVRTAYLMRYGSPG